MKNSLKIPNPDGNHTFWNMVSTELYAGAAGIIQEKFEDTKRVIRCRKSKKDIQHNGQKKNDNRTNNDLQNTTLQIEQYEPHYKLA